MLEAAQSTYAVVALWIFVVAPSVALLAAVRVAWGWGLSALDAIMAGVGYLVAVAGVTVGCHRHLTHGAFKGRPVRIALAVAGSLAVEGAPTGWVADHRRHHAFADREGDPALALALRHRRARADQRSAVRPLRLVLQQGRDQQGPLRAGPADRGIRVVDRLFLPLFAVSLLLPALLGGLITGTWTGALTGFFWAGLVRMALLHHVTWSVNSICHVVGERPFNSKDKGDQLLAPTILSFGESWHNSHHADPTGARHACCAGSWMPAPG